MRDRTITTNLTIVKIAEDLANINLEALEKPDTEEKCEHYKALGPADDDLKRLWALYVQYGREQDEAMPAFKVLAAEYRATVAGSPEEAEVKARMDPVRIDLENRKLLHSVVGRLLQIEVRRQFPELYDLHNVGISIDQDWVVGYTDHSELGAEMAEVLAAFGGLGIGVMVMGRGDASSEGGDQPKH